MQYLQSLVSGEGGMEGGSGIFFVGFYFIFYFFPPPLHGKGFLPAEGAAKQQGGQGHGARSKKRPVLWLTLGKRL